MPTFKSPSVWWRVSGGGFTDTVDQAFVLNPDSFFVNDTNTTGDIYCFAIGSVTNRGILPGAPALFLQDVIDLNDLEPG